MSIIALRLAVGYHFFQEGNKKIKSGDFSSVPFFTSANGDFAPFFHSMVGDRDGLKRLGYREDQQGPNKIDLQPTFAIWNQYTNQIKAHYRFGDRSLEQSIQNRREETKARINAARDAGEDPDPEDVQSYEQDEELILTIRTQEKLADQALERCKSDLTAYMNAYEEEINNYFLGLNQRMRGFRRDGINRQQVIQEVPSLEGQAKSIEQDMKKERGPWLAAVESGWDTLEEELNGLAVDSQKSYGYLELERPYDASPMLQIVDRIIPWFDLVVGILLIFGLFSRLASMAGGLFLMGVIATQTPWSPGSMDTYYQCIEMFALFVLAGTWAGYYGGLDFFVHQLVITIFPPKEDEFE